MATIHLRAEDGVTPMGEVDGGLEDIFTLETMEELIQQHRANGTALIIARVKTREKEDISRTYYSYYAAHKLNKLLLRKRGREIVSRFSEPERAVHARNPLSNSEILGEVYYFMVQPEKNASVSWNGVRSEEQRSLVAHAPSLNSSRQPYAVRNNSFLSASDNVSDAMAGFGRSSRWERSVLGEVATPMASEFGTLSEPHTPSHSGRRSTTPLNSAHDQTATSADLQQLRRSQSHDSPIHPSFPRSRAGSMSTAGLVSPTLPRSVVSAASAQSLSREGSVPALNSVGTKVTSESSSDSDCSSDSDSGSGSGSGSGVRAKREASGDAVGMARLSGDGSVNNNAGSSDTAKPKTKKDRARGKKQTDSERALSVTSTSTTTTTTTTITTNAANAYGVSPLAVPLAYTQAPRPTLPPLTTVGRRASTKRHSVLSSVAGSVDTDRSGGGGVVGGSESGGGGGGGVSAVSVISGVSGGRVAELSGRGSGLSLARGGAGGGASGDGTQTNAHSNDSGNTTNICTEGDVDKARVGGSSVSSGGGGGGGGLERVLGRTGHSASRQSVLTTESEMATTNVEARAAVVLNDHEDDSWSGDEERTPRHLRFRRRLGLVADDDVAGHDSSTSSESSIFAYRVTRMKSDDGGVGVGVSKEGSEPDGLDDSTAREYTAVFIGTDYNFVFSSDLRKTFEDNSLDKEDAELTAEAAPPSRRINLQGEQNFLNLLARLPATEPGAASYRVPYSRAVVYGGCGAAYGILTAVVFAAAVAEVAGTPASVGRWLWAFLPVLSFTTDRFTASLFHVSELKGIIITKIIYWLFFVVFPVTAFHNQMAKYNVARLVLNFTFPLAAFLYSVSFYTFLSSHATLT